MLYALRDDAHRAPRRLWGNMKTAKMVYNGNDMLQTRRV